VSSQNCEKRLTASSCPSVRLSAWNSTPTGRNFMKIEIFNIFRKSVEKIQISLHRARITGTLHEDQFTFSIISPSVLLIMKNISYESYTETQNTYYTFNNFFSRKSCLLWDNMEKCCRAGQATDDNMAHAHCMLDT